MPTSDSLVSAKAIGWALIGQTVWLIPLLGTVVNDRWVARQRYITTPGEPQPESPITRATPFSLNDVLGAPTHVQQLAGQAGQAISGAFGKALRGSSSGVGVLLSSAGSGASSLLDRPFTVSVDLPAAAAGTASSPGSVSQRSPEGSLTELPLPSLRADSYSQAQLLGGSIGLADLQEGAMPPLALVQRSLQRSSPDPLEPLPAFWRAPIRQALQRLPGKPQKLSRARLISLPSSLVSEPVDVPLALQSDGSVDIFEPPTNPAVLQEIEGWSRQQRLPATGSLTPAIVHLHPLPPHTSPQPDTSRSSTSSATASDPAVSGVSTKRNNPASRAASNPASLPASLAVSARQTVVLAPINGPSAASGAPILEPQRGDSSSPIVPSSQSNLSISSATPEAATTPLEDMAPEQTAVSAAAVAETALTP